MPTGLRWLRFRVARVTDEDIDVLAAMARLVPEGSRPVGMICLNEDGRICLLYHDVVTSDAMAAILKAAQASMKHQNTLQ